VPRRARPEMMTLNKQAEEGELVFGPCYVGPASSNSRERTKRIQILSLPIKSLYWLNVGNFAQIFGRSPIPIKCASGVRTWCFRLWARTAPVMGRTLAPMAMRGQFAAINHAQTDRRRPYFVCHWQRELGAVGSDRLRARKNTIDASQTSRRCGIALPKYGQFSSPKANCRRVSHGCVAWSRNEPSLSSHFG